MIKSIYAHLLEVGVTDELSETNKRQVRLTNIATFLSILYLICWIPIAHVLQDGLLPNIINMIAVILFTPVFILNKHGKRAMAAILYISVAYLLILLNVYMYGYQSGTHLIYVITIPLCFIIIPYQRRKLVMIFALLCAFTWVGIVLFREHFTPHLPGVNSIFNLEINVAFIALLLLLMFYNFANTIHRAEMSLELERGKSDALLHNILPKFIAKRLKEKQTPIADGISMASVLFADLVGFTQLSEKLSPEQLVQQLDELFSTFDKLSEEYGLEKIKTIGDAYMIAGGLQRKNSDHLEKMAHMALSMLATIDARNSRLKDQLQIRIGIHVGPVVAGVIGFKKFAYDIWGDTVNTASRMESQGLPGKIHVSQKVKNRLSEKFLFEYRGKIEIKGKGLKDTYFLTQIKMK